MLLPIYICYNNNFRVTTRKQALKMISNLYSPKDKKTNVYEEAGRVNPEKLMISLDYSSSVENKLENSDEIFQMNTLDASKPLQNQQKTMENFQNFVITIEVEGRRNEKVNTPQKSQSLKKRCPFKAVLEPYHFYLSKVYQPFKQDRLFQYIHRRNSQHSIQKQNKIDLGVYSLKEVVEFCVQKKIISNNVYIDFTYQSIQNEEENFVDKLNNKKIESIEFQKMYFTPLDHRLLSKILSDQFPYQFEFPKKPLLQKPKMTIFYSFLYWVQQQQYIQMCAILNHKFCRIWMPSNIVDFSTIVSEKIKNKPRLSEQESFPFHLPLRKLRKKY